MPVDDAKVTALKQRRAAFLASGLPEKAAAVDRELARLRGVSVPAPGPDATPEPEPTPPVVETAEADLTGVESAAVPRRRGRQPRQR